MFLFDEPLSNLDAKLRVQMRTEIKKVHQTVRTTTVYVTHDQIEAMTLADRVVVMNHGVIEQVGTPNELYHHPTTRFVAGFIGSPAMNFLPCRVQDGANGGLAVRVTDQIVLPVPPARVERYGKYKGREMVLGTAAGASVRIPRERQARAGRGSICRSMWWSRWAWRRWSTSSSATTRSAPASIRRRTPSPARCCR